LTIVKSFPSGGTKLKKNENYGDGQMSFDATLTVGYEDMTIEIMLSA
jgi:hypothetical protein